jgi:hypothetical protein
MTTRRVRTFAAAGALMAGALVASPAVAAADSAGTALSTAVAGLKGQGYDLTGSTGSTAAGGTGKLNANGSVDPQDSAATLDFQGTIGGNPVDVDFIQVGNAFYAKLDLGALQSQLGVPASQWMTVDESKLQPGSSAVPFDLSGSSDALDISGLLTSVSDVHFAQPGDTTHIAGTVDLTAATGVAAPDPTDVKDAGAAAKTTPFTATLDSQGRLTDLRVDADSFDGNLSEEIAFSHYGSPQSVSAPPASVPAPAAAYEFFND